MPQHADILWKLLWDYDPNGLLVVDEHMMIRLVNRSLCEMFQQTEADLTNTKAEALLGNVDELRRSWTANCVIKSAATEYPKYHLYARKVIFPIREMGFVACIMVDLTHELEQQQEIQRIQRETIQQVNDVVNKQMLVAQQVAGLLGETTAETKVSLIRLRKMLEGERAAV